MSIEDSVESRLSRAMPKLLGGLDVEKDESASTTRKVIETVLEGSTSEVPPVETPDDESLEVTVRRRERDLPPLHSAVHFLSKPCVRASGHLVTLHITFSLYDRRLLKRAKFFLRWGSYDDITEHWHDEEIPAESIKFSRSSFYTIDHTFEVVRRGFYGATVYVVDAETGHRIWQGRAHLDDAKFRIDTDSQEAAERIRVKHHSAWEDAERLFVEHLESYGDFEKGVAGLGSHGTQDLARVLYERTRKDEELRDLLSRLRSTACGRVGADDERQEDASRVCAMLDNIGIGRVLLIAPEGPHAACGGLAQVMNGLLKSLTLCGIPVTLVSCLYENEQGSQHPSADTVIREGITLNDRHVDVRWIGEVDIPYGPTYRAGTECWVQHTHLVKTQVYEARDRTARVILLRHWRYADRLYPQLNADEALRRAIFLSRGALEVIRNPLFEVRPQLILSNDWVTALVPVLVKLDMRYAGNEAFKGVRTVHLIHNCGRDYHGCFPVVHDGQDLWPMLELGREHLYGLVDPNNHNLFNLTAGAIFHLDGALVAVSKPYAQQLLSWEGSEGLNGVLWDKRSAVFGISNGIDQQKLRSKIVEVGERSIDELGWDKLPSPGSDVPQFVENLRTYKRATKMEVQRRLGLDQNPDRRLVSLIGRLAEQKGIQLLHGCAPDEGISVMESILRRYPDVQFAIAGPMVHGHPVSNHFRAHVEYLSWAFGGRVSGIYDYIPHSEALEIFTASDLFLMPSRYEPGGITQLEALTCGTLVVARNVGGISATLKKVDESGEGNSFLFDEFSPRALRDTLTWALDSIYDDGHRDYLIRQAALSQHDWSDRMPEYLSLFQHVTGVLNQENSYKHLESRLSVLEKLRP